MDESRFLALVRRNRVNAAILDRLGDIGLTDPWLVSGALFQTVWNVLTERPPTHGILDYDVFYFDDTDLSWEAEDAWIKAVDGAFSDLGVKVELRNQARVHLWYPSKFGAPYPAMSDAKQSIDHFLAKACMVGLSPGEANAPILYAPAGLTDIENLTIRPNYTSNFQPIRYREKAERWRRDWPELTIIDPVAAT
ncbi:MAG: nucleotidyltransferase family protein [Pseudomonadota bacterium]